MKYLLDTNTCIRHLNQRSPSITRRLNRVVETDIAVCSVVKAQLFFLRRFASLPFDDAAASIYGKIRAELAAKGTPIGPDDLFIAAIVLANN